MQTRGRPGKPALRVPSFTACAPSRWPPAQSSRGCSALTQARFGEWLPSSSRLCFLGKRSIQRSGERRASCLFFDQVSRTMQRPFSSVKFSLVLVDLTHVGQGSMSDGPNNMEI